MILKVILSVALLSELCEAFFFKGKSCKSLGQTCITKTGNPGLCGVDPFWLKIVPKTCKETPPTPPPTTTSTTTPTSTPTPTPLTCNGDTLNVPNSVILLEGNVNDEESSPITCNLGFELNFKYQCLSAFLGFKQIVECVPLTDKRRKKRSDHKSRQTDEQPDCEQQAKPTVDNGNVQFSNPIPAGEIALVTCNPGFGLSVTVVCRMPGFNLTPKCEALS